MFKNNFNTVMDVKGKTKDNIKVKMDIPFFFFYHCNTMKLVYDGSRVAKLKASFTLEMNALLLGYQ
jgi:hypothetical protein